MHGPDVSVHDLQRAELRHPGQRLGGHERQRLGRGAAHVERQLCHVRLRPKLAPDGRFTGLAIVEHPTVGRRGRLRLRVVTVTVQVDGGLLFERADVYIGADTATAVLVIVRVAPHARSLAFPSPVRHVTVVVVHKDREHQPQCHELLLTRHLKNLQEKKIRKFHICYI